MSDLFLRILNISLSASFVVLAVVALRFLLKKAPKWLNPVLWGMVGARLLFPVSIESVLSLLPSSQVIPADIAYAQRPAITSGIPAVNHAVNPILTETFAPDLGASVNPLQIWLEIGGWVWIAGMAAMLAYTGFTYYRLRRRVSGALRLRDSCYQCDAVASPFVLGLFRPRIYLPYGLGEEEQFYILAHENAHIQRCDHLWKPLGFVLLAVHWFNPLLWLCYILLCRDIELACDEKVIGKLGREGRADYSQALLTCAVSRRSIAACPLAFGEVGVKERISSVLKYRKPLIWVVDLSVLLCVVFAVCFLTDPPLKLPFMEEKLPITAAVLGEAGQPVSMEFDQWEREDLARRLKELKKLRPYEAEKDGEMKTQYTLEAAFENGETLVIEGTLEENAGMGLTYAGKQYRLEDPNFASWLKGACAEKNIAQGAKTAWGVELRITESTPTGAEVLFVGGETAEGETWGSNDFVLQKYEDGIWADLPQTAAPNWAAASYLIPNNRRHAIDWAWLYGSLDPGRYRLGKRVWFRSAYADGGNALVWAEFELGGPREEGWTVEMTVEAGSPHGVTVMFWPGERPDGTDLNAEESYVLQEKTEKGWQDRQGSMSSEGYPVLNGTSQVIRWQEPLPDGTYRLCKNLNVQYGFGRLGQMTASAEFRVDTSGGAGPLTADDVLELSEKGYDLSWGDFEKFDYVEVDYKKMPMAFHRFYDLEGPLELSINGDGLDQKPQNITLSCDQEQEHRECVELMRWGDQTGDFISLHGGPLAPGQTNHYGLTLAVRDASPTGAQLIFEADPPEGITLRGSDQYSLDRLTEAGLWEEVPTLEGAQWGVEHLWDSYITSRELQWEDRYGLLPGGHYRLGINVQGVGSVWSISSSTPFYAEFDIIQTQPEDWGVTMTAQDYEFMGIQLRLSRSGDVSPQPLYMNSGYVFQQWDGESWQTKSRVASRWDGSTVQIDFDRPDQGPIIEYKAFGQLVNGRYRILKEISPSLDGTGGFYVGAEFTVDTGEAPFGYTPLEMLPGNYSPMQAAEDGCLVMTDGAADTGVGLFTQFWSKAFEQQEAFLRFVSCYTDGSGDVDRLWVHDLTYDGGGYTLRWMENGRVQEERYRYLKHFEQGFPENPDDPCVYSWDVLTNDENLKMPSYAPERGEIGPVSEHQVVCSVKTYRYGPQLHGSLYQAKLEFEGKKQLVVTDDGQLWQLHWLLSAAEPLEDQDGFTDKGLHLRLTIDDGTEVLAELDPARGRLRLGGEVCSYEAVGDITLLWEYLGIEAWPEAVYEQYPEAYWPQGGS